VTVSKTEKLYLNDPYSVSFRARVIDWKSDDDGRGVITLDRSCFYPESGGQTADIGVIGSVPVVDVQEGDGETVLHFVDTTVVEAPPAAGDEVECRVDWPRRFDHMQQHTGQHVLSRAFIQVAGLHTVSFHLGEDSCTIDLEGAGFKDDVAVRAENLANAIVVENRPVAIKTLPAAELEQLSDLELRRSLPEGVTEARLVEVKDFDVIPCCGTHVGSTGELGLIKVLKSEKAKGFRRVHFKVGERALRDYRSKHDIVQALGSRLTTSADDIAAKVEKLAAENQRTRKDLKRLSQALAGYESKTLLEEAAVHSGTRIIVRYFPDRDDEFLRMISTTLKGEPNTAVVIGSVTGAVVCSASDGVAVDFAALAVEPARAAGGSGGGKGAFAQLKLPAGTNISNFVEEIADNVKKSLSS
jgi:alanyl-tRNA synthetase